MLVQRPAERQSPRRCGGKGVGGKREGEGEREVPSLMAPESRPAFAPEVITGRGDGGEAMEMACRASSFIGYRVRWNLDQTRKNSCSSRHRGASLAVLHSEILAVQEIVLTRPVVVLGRHPLRHFRLQRHSR